ncbi:hypothetical protein G6F46_014050 [Rhizopus delemar]|nr:hypothetical protein G6F46_014050 [Rhizopus delemar]
MHPAGIFGRQRTDLVQRGQFVLRQLDAGGGQVVVQLIDTLGADDDAGHHLLVQQPGQGHLRDRHAARISPRFQDVDAVIGAVAVDRREVERGAAATGFGRPGAAVLAAEQAASQRAPHHQAHPFALQHGDQFAFQVAARDRAAQLETPT